MLRVALTGGIATGKSRCLERFAALGVPTIDADALARAVVATGTPGLAAVVHRFGRNILRDNGELDRDKLAGIVFSDPGARRDLEAIVHPPVYQAIDEWFARLEAEQSGSRGRRTLSRIKADPSLWRAPSPGPPLAIADVPLLFESRRHRDFDKVIVVVCRPEQQLERLLARQGTSEADARQRIDSQMALEKKKKKADYVIDTSGSLAETDRQVEEVWRSLKESAI
jgi:dephospho-CoA kinase